MLSLNFLKEKAGSKGFFKLEIAKLVQANFILTHLIKETAIEKYQI